MQSCHCSSLPKASEPCSTFAFACERKILFDLSESTIVSVEAQSKNLPSTPTKLFTEFLQCLLHECLVIDLVLNGVVRFEAPVLLTQEWHPTFFQLLVNGLGITRCIVHVYADATLHSERFLRGYFIYRLRLCKIREICHDPRHL